MPITPAYNNCLRFYYGQVTTVPYEVRFSGLKAFVTIRNTKDIDSMKS